MTALFIMVVTSTVVIAMIDTQTLHYLSLRNTLDYDRARYLAEAGLQDSIARLEADINWRAGSTNVTFPPGSSTHYSTVVTDGANGSVVIVATGVSGSVTRRIQTTVKQGG